MCGIAGIIADQDYTAPAARMIHQMHHRGPDDSGVQAIAAGSRRVILGSTRLAIIDLSEAGHMPMADPQTGNWIVYNGEVYNFTELRQELAAAGVRFRSGTDTEVLLQAYQHWGAACVQRFRGMFAFAIWDQRRQELFLARDRIGKKPLYYHQGADGAFLFASEIRALLDSGLVARRLNPTALEVFLFNGFVISPITMVRDVYSMLPGHWIRVSADGRIVETVRYWRLPAAPTDHRTPDNLPDLIAEARVRMEEAVALRLVSDVPLGAFLSGGLDSSTIVALMARSGQDVRTFSITFDEASFDESPFARWVAERFATKHTEIKLQRDDFTTWLPDALAAMDQPTFDGVNSYCVARATREHGVTVALSGLGGDEVFGGYQEFTLAPRLAWFGRLAHALPARLSELVEAWPAQQPFRVPGPLKALEFFHHDDQRRSRMLDLLASYQTLAVVLPYWTRRQLLANRATRAEPATWFGLPPDFLSFVQDTAGDDGARSVISRFSSSLFLAERTLRDTDTMSMGVSLEVRAPFTDHLFVESIWKIPASIRCGGTPYKPFQWQLVKPYLGEDYPYRKKQGFSFPFEKWLREQDFRERIQATFSNSQLAQDIGFRPAEVQQLCKVFYQEQQPMHWSGIWALYVLFWWCEHNQLSL